MKSQVRINKKFFFISVVKKVTLIELPRGAFSKSIAIGTQTS